MVKRKNGEGESRKGRKVGEKPQYNRPPFFVIGLRGGFQYFF
jgi:hypothetical protein